MRVYEQQLSLDTQKSAYQLVDKIKKAVQDVRQAASKHTHVGRSADDFLSELEQEEVIKNFDHL